MNHDEREQYYQKILHNVLDEYFPKAYKAMKKNGIFK